MTVAQHICSCLAVKLWNEENSDALQGWISRGLVIRNRILAGWGEWLDLLSRHEQWSANPKENVRVNLGSVNDPTFKRLLGISENIYSGLEKDITYGALYYCQLNQITSDWFLNNIVRKPNEHPRIAQVGKLQFFK